MFISYLLTRLLTYSLIHLGIRESLLPGIDIRCFFLSEPRDHLYRYIDSRCETMLQNGTHSLTHTYLLTHSVTYSLVSRVIGRSDVIAAVRQAASRHEHSEVHRVSADDPVFVSSPTRARGLQGV